MKWLDALTTTTRQASQAVPADAGRRAESQINQYEQIADYNRINDRINMIEESVIKADHIIHPIEDNNGKKCALQTDQRPYAAFKVYIRFVWILNVGFKWFSFFRCYR